MFYVLWAIITCQCPSGLFVLFFERINWLIDWLIDWKLGNIFHASTSTIFVRFIFGYGTSKIPLICAVACDASVKTSRGLRLQSSHEKWCRKDVQNLNKIIFFSRMWALKLVTALWLFVWTIGTLLNPSMPKRGKSTASCFAHSYRTLADICRLFDKHLYSTLIVILFITASKSHGQSSERHSDARRERCLCQCY